MPLRAIAFEQLDVFEDVVLRFCAETVEFGDALFFFVRDPDGNVIEFHLPAK